jgi:hypothetical protein
LALPGNHWKVLLRQSCRATGSTNTVLVTGHEMGNPTLVMDS